jgi:hypothetical protein
MASFGNVTFNKSTGPFAACYRFSQILGDNANTILQTVLKSNENT